MIHLAATAAVVGIDPARILHATLEDLPVWEAIVHQAAHEAHTRDKSLAAHIARATWGK